MDLTVAWSSVEHDGWEVVWLGRRVGRPGPRRWLAQAVRYGQHLPMRVQAWGETSVAALTNLADATKPSQRGK